MFLPFIVLKVWMDCRFLNDAISTATVIFIELRPITFAGLERKMSLCISLYPYSPRVHLEELYNHKYLSQPNIRNRSFQNISGMLPCSVFHGRRIRFSHEYCALSQSFQGKAGMLSSDRPRPLPPRLFPLHSDNGHIISLHIT